MGRGKKGSENEEDIYDKKDRGRRRPRREKLEAVQSVADGIETPSAELSEAKNRLDRFLSDSETILKLIKEKAGANLDLVKKTEEEILTVTDKANKAFEDLKKDMGGEMGQILLTVFNDEIDKLNEELNKIKLDSENKSENNLKKRADKFLQILVQRANKRDDGLSTEYHRIGLEELGKLIESERERIDHLKESFWNGQEKGAAGKIYQKLIEAGLKDKAEEFKSRCLELNFRYLPLMEKVYAKRLINRNTKKPDVNGGLEESVAETDIDLSAKVEAERKALEAEAETAFKEIENNPQYTLSAEDKEKYFEYLIIGNFTPGLETKTSEYSLLMRIKSSNARNIENSKAKDFKIYRRLKDFDESHDTDLGQNFKNRCVGFFGPRQKELAEIEVNGASIGKKINEDIDILVKKIENHELSLEGAKSSLENNIKIIRGLSENVINAAVSELERRAGIAEETREALVGSGAQAPESKGAGSEGDAEGAPEAATGSVETNAPEVSADVASGEGGSEAGRESPDGSEGAQEIQPENEDLTSPFPDPEETQEMPVQGTRPDEPPIYPQGSEDEELKIEDGEGARTTESEPTGPVFPDGQRLAASQSAEINRLVKEGLAAGRNPTPINHEMKELTHHEVTEIEGNIRRSLDSYRKAYSKVEPELVNEAREIIKELKKEAEVFLENFETEVQGRPDEYQGKPVRIFARRIDSTLERLRLLFDLYKGEKQYYSSNDNLVFLRNRYNSFLKDYQQLEEDDKEKEIIVRVMLNVIRDRIEESLDQQKFHKSKEEADPLRKVLKKYGVKWRDLYYLAPNPDSKLVGRNIVTPVDNYHDYLKMMRGWSEEELSNFSELGPKVTIESDLPGAAQAEIEETMFKLRARELNDEFFENVVQFSGKGDSLLAKETLEHLGLGIKASDIRDGVFEEVAFQSNAEQVFEFGGSVNDEIKEVIGELEIGTILTDEDKNEIIAGIQASLNSALDQEALREFSKIKHHKIELASAVGVGAVAALATIPVRIIAGPMVTASKVFSEAAFVTAGALLGGSLGALRGKLMNAFNPVMERLRKRGKKKVEAIRAEKAEKIFTGENVKMLLIKEIRGALLEKTLGAYLNNKGTLSDEELANLISANMPKFRELDRNERECVIRSLKGLVAVSNENSRKLGKLLERQTIGEGAVKRSAAMGAAVGSMSSLAQTLAESPYLPSIAAGALAGLYTGQTIHQIWSKKDIEKMVTGKGGIAENVDSIGLWSELGSITKESLVYLKSQLESGILDDYPLVKAKATTIIIQQLIRGEKIDEFLVAEEMQKDRKHLKTMGRLRGTVSYSAGIAGGMLLGGLSTFGLHLAKEYFNQGGDSSGSKVLVRKPLPQPEKQPVPKAPLAKGSGPRTEPPAPGPASDKLSAQLAEAPKSSPGQPEQSNPKSQLRSSSRSGKAASEPQSKGTGSPEQSAIRTSETEPNPTRGLKNNFELDLGKGKVPPQLERVFQMMAVDKMQNALGKDHVFGEEEGAKSLNVAANLIRLTEGKGVAGFKPAAIKDIFSWDAKSQKLTIINYEKFNQLMDHLEEHADKLWENGKLDGAVEYLDDIKKGTWKKIIDAEGLENKVEGHDEIKPEQIKDFGKRSHEAPDTQKAKAGNVHETKNAKAGQGAELHHKKAGDQSAPETHKTAKPRDIERQILAAGHKKGGEWQKINFDNEYGLSAAAADQDGDGVIDAVNIVDQDGNRLAVYSRPSVQDLGKFSHQIKFELDKFIDDKKALFLDMVGNKGVTPEMANKAGINIMDGFTNEEKNMVDFWVKNHSTFPLEKPERVGQYFQLVKKSGLSYSEAHVLEAYKKLPPDFLKDERLGRAFLKIFAGSFSSGEVAKGTSELLNLPPPYPKIIPRLDGSIIAQHRGIEFIIGQKYIDVASARPGEILNTGELAAKLNGRGPYEINLHNLIEISQWANKYQRANLLEKRLMS